MSDYRIDVRQGLTIEGMSTGAPEAHLRTIVEINLTRYGYNGKQLKPELLWGPTIMEVGSFGDLLIVLAPIFAKVVQAHQEGQPTQVQFIQP